MFRTIAKPARIHKKLLSVQQKANSGSTSSSPSPSNSSASSNARRQQSTGEHAHANGGSGSSTNNGSDGRSFFNRLWDRYTEALLRNPLTIKGTTASIIFFASDSATQYLTEDADSYDITRASSGAAFGVVATCWLHYWWNFLEGAVSRKLVPSKLTNTLIKVVLDQTLAAPCYIYGYYVVTNFIQDYGATYRQPRKSRKSAEQVFHETTELAGEMLLPTMLRHWTVWPAVHTLNFYFNPLHHRVLVQNLVLVGWSGYLSHLNNGGLMTPKDEIEVTIKRRATLEDPDTPVIITAKATAPSANSVIGVLNR